MAAPDGDPTPARPETGRGPRAHPVRDPATDADSGPRADGLAGWAALHGGIQPSPLVRGWLLGVQWSARSVSWVPPDVLSALSVLAAVGAVGAAAAGGRWPLLAAALVVATGVLDGLDGAVALATGKARPLGAVIDAVADRLGDVALAGVLAVLGGAPGWVLAAIGLVGLHEYLRARAQGVGMPGPGAVTIAERPTRIVLLAAITLGAGTLPGGVPLLGWGWGTTGAVGWTAIGAVGLVQLAVGVRRAFRPR